MGQLLATLRHRPAPLIGTFVALTLAAMLITMTAIFLGTGLTLSVPAQQLAGTTVVVTGKPNVSIVAGSGAKHRDRRALSSRLPTSAGRARRSPGFGARCGVRRPQPLLPGRLGVGQRERYDGQYGRPDRGARMGKCCADPLSSEQRPSADRN